MQKNVGNKIRLGVLVSIGLTLFIVGIYFIGKRQQLFSNTFQVNAIFKDIGGLQIGNNVRFSGINVGIVDNIEQITDSTVKVNMVINEDTQKFIKKNAKAIIGSDGLMGNKIVLITPGTPGKPALADGDNIQTSQPITMDDILLKIKITTDNTATMTTDLSSIIGSIRQGKGTIGKLFMDTILAENIDQTIVNIKQGAGGFKQNMNAVSHNFLFRNYFNKKKDKKK